MIRISVILGLSLALSACVTTSRDVESVVVERMPVAATPAAEIAALLSADLDRRSRYDAASLAAVEDDLRRLAVRLAAPPEPEPEPDPPAPDPVGGESLMHAIHLASYRTQQNAVAGWQSLQALFPDLMLDREARIESADLGSRGVFLRLKAGPFLTGAEARAACAEIEAAGGWCAVTDFTGQLLTP